MGEVYRARDEKLNRDVAIKVLPASLSQDVDRLRRFEQEAQAAGTLNHPNILAVYDVGTHDGAPYIVSELLGGEELREQLNDGLLPQRKALDYAQQIAQGLAASHERGITHRDLKPENLFVTTEGRVKILDFGLAKLRRQRSEIVSSEIDTRKQITDPGTVMGTVGYMSPEQVRGQEADHRSDIFSFGLILYEMLSGQRAFRRETMAETMTAILKEEPSELSETNTKISLSLEKIVRRCLEKKPERRFHSASDLAFAIENLSRAATSSGQTMTLTSPRLEPAGMSRLFGNARLAWIVAAVFLFALVTALALLYMRQPSTESQVTRLSIELPKGTIAFGSSYAPVLALSRDGRRLIFEATDSAGKRQLWLRALDSFASQPLSGTEASSSLRRGVHFPFWSPDGRYVAFFVDNTLKRLDTGTGVVEVICQAVTPWGGDWNRDGEILFSNGTVLLRVNPAGGNPEAVTEVDPAHGKTSLMFPSFLPDGRHYLFRIAGSERDGVYVGSLDSGERKLLIPLSLESANSTRVAFAPPGHIFYVVNRTTLLAQAFDPVRLEVQGEPIRVAENVFNGGPGGPRFTVSANGVLAFIQGGAGDTVQLTWCDRGGKRLNQVGPAASWTDLGLSLNERFAAVTRYEPNNSNSLWLLDLVQGATSRLVTEGDNYGAAWSPDGKQLAFSSVRNSPPNLFLKQVEGNVPEERLLESGSMSFPSSWTPDGKFLIYRTQDLKTGWDVWMLPLSGDRKPQPLLQTKASEQHGEVSPDGKWLAYDSDESGSIEVYVTQFPQPARSWRVSTSGGTQPHWRGDGKELFFVSGDKLMAVSVSSGTEFQAGTPQPLFDIERGIYAPSKDGQRFLVRVTTEKAPSPPISVVLNWSSGLKK
jgi:serine/threonine protein kinase